MNPRESLRAEVRDVVVRGLGLEIEPEQLGEDESLFPGRFGLDSVDLLYAVIAVEKEFGVNVPENVDYAVRFRTVSSIVELVRELMEQGGERPAGEERG